MSPNSHRTRDATRNATQANGTCCCCQWEGSHCSQATSKEKRSSRVLCELGLNLLHCELWKRQLCHQTRPGVVTSGLLILTKRTTCQGGGKERKAIRNAPVLQKGQTVILFSGMKPWPADKKDHQTLHKKKRKLIPLLVHLFLLTICCCAFSRIKV